MRSCTVGSTKRRVGRPIWPINQAGVELDWAELGRALQGRAECAAGDRQTITVQVAARVEWALRPSRPLQVSRLRWRPQSRHARRRPVRGSGLALVTRGLCRSARLSHFARPRHATAGNGNGKWRTAPSGVHRLLWWRRGSGSLCYGTLCKAAKQAARFLGPSSRPSHPGPPAFTRPV